MKGSRRSNFESDRSKDEIRIRSRCRRPAQKRFIGCELSALLKKRKLNFRQGRFLRTLAVVPYNANCLAKSPSFFRSVTRKKFFLRPQASLPCNAGIVKAQGLASQELSLQLRILEVS